MKAAKIAGTVFLLALLLTTGILIFILPDREYSETENRVLSQKPEPDISSVLDSEFQSGLSEYLSDQFPARDLFMTVGTEINIASGQRDIEDTYIGTDNSYFEKLLPEDVTEKSLKKNLTAVDRLAGEFPDTDFSLMMIPPAGCIYSERLPLFAEMFDCQSAEKTTEKEARNIKVVSAYEVLKKSKDRYIFYRNDHHWTALGAYECYKALKKDGKAVYSDKNKASDSFLGTLSSRVPQFFTKPDSIILPEIPDGLSVVANGEKSSIYVRDELDNKNQYRVFFGGDHGIVDIRGGKGEKTLLVIKDSFADSFVPYLTYDYSRIIMIDPRYYSASVKQLLRNEKIDEVLVLYEMNAFINNEDIVKLYM